MVMRRFSLVSLLTLGLLAAACGSPPPPEPPPSAPATPPAEPAAPATPPPTDQAAPGADAAKPAEPAAEPAPAPKPAKEKIVGQWQFDFSGEPRGAMEADLKKKAGKDDKKFEQLMKEAEEAAKGEWIEFTPDGNYVSHITEKGGKDKVVAKIKYEVVKEEGSTLTMKGVGKDEISKKEMKDEVAIFFKDDNTIEMKDPKSKRTLVFKRK